MTYRRGASSHSSQSGQSGPLKSRTSSNGGSGGRSSRGYSRHENNGARRKEPLSLAEELAKERDRGIPETDYDEYYQKLRESGEATFLSELQSMSMQEIIAEARRQNIEDVAGAQKQELIFKILKQRIKKNGLMYGEGTLEILPDEFGFLRSPDYHYLSCPDDIYISPSQIRRFGMRTGSTVSGQIRPPKENERYFALLRVEAINHEDPNLLSQKPMFDDLTPLHPDSRIVMEDPDGDMNTRVVDLIVPVGFGQRGLIVSPPRAGKTILMQKMAQAALKNYPDLYVFMLLIDERPEEVTDMERQVKGPQCEVISSTFDEPPTRHIQVSEMVLEKAKRMVEYGKNVIIFLDSITRLARAWNSECPSSGKLLSGGVDANALQRPKRFFGTARKVEEGGSMTIIATALVDTGSRMDEVIFEEFKGTGNLEIVLDRQLVDKRIWPAIDINSSGTRREEMLMDPEEYRRVSLLRRVLSDMNSPEAMEFLTTRLAKYKTNAEFLMHLNIQ
jgi:transcription termination factor Rho